MAWPGCVFNLVKIFVFHLGSRVMEDNSLEGRTMSPKSSSSTHFSTLSKYSSSICDHVTLRKPRRTWESMEASKINRGLCWQTWVALLAPLNLFRRGDIEKAKKDMGIYGSLKYQWRPVLAHLGRLAFAVEFVPSWRHRESQEGHGYLWKPLVSLAACSGRLGSPCLRR